MSDLIERAKAILTYPKVGEDTKAVIRDLMTALTAALARPAEGDGWKPILRELADAAEYDLTMNQGDDCEGWWTLRTLLAIRAARKLLATRPAQAEDGELRNLCKAVDAAAIATTEPDMIAIPAAQWARVMARVDIKQPEETSR